MKLISWNVNGLRAAIKKGFLDFFNEVNADIFCLQEIKMNQNQLTLNFPNYHQYFNSAEKKGYSGTAIFTKTKPINVTYGIYNDYFNNEGRVITIELEKIFVVTVYTPNSKRELLRLDYRMKWEDAFKDYLLMLEENKPVIICGDLNVAHKEIDLKNPKANTKNPGFTKEERDKFTALLQSGYVDSFRYLYPDKKDEYTWWSYMGSAREKNVGWRIDYFLVSTYIKNNIKEAIIYKDIFGSDHCPVGLVID
ncbi:MAG: exodeoxyribonuclease III [Defluviitaleaceae bacterium]|nr:exodeoxyribonuclease III [Defluviitaleaceae bacterium]